MTRTRAQRRHNTQVKTSARKADTCRCSGKISRNGESATCNLCNGAMHYERDNYRILNDIRMCGWYQAHSDF